jgi:hypothetical protein
MATRNARVSDLAVAKVRRFCDQRVPAEARNEVCLGLRPGAPPSPSLSADRCGRAGPALGRACRSPNFATTPPQAPGPCTGWAGRNRRWHRYDDLDPTPQPDDLLKEIDEDPLSIFWG